MLRDGIIKLSSNFTVYDYTDLNLRIDSEAYKWERAITIIEERFNERFFSTIYYLSYDFSTNRYSEQKVEKNGFAIMALNCLLVDTFYQFENGLESTNRINNAAYTSFINELFPDLSNTNLAQLFYKRIRCGILHSGQTYGYSVLTCDGGDIISEFPDAEGRQGIRVDIVGFSRRLREYYNLYLGRLRNGDYQTRDNFIKKMNYVCSLDNP